jgi:hypothetical protein
MATVNKQTVRNYLIENFPSIPPTLITMSLDHTVAQDAIRKAAAAGDDIETPARRIANYFHWDTIPWSNI